MGSELPAKALTRIKDLLERIRAECTEESGQPCEWSGRYDAQLCLSQQELTVWETANQVLLPLEYRLFLLEIGNGGMMPGDYCNFEVWSLGSAPPNPGLLQPFPVTTARLTERRAQYRREERRFLPELDEYWENGQEPPGCLAVAQYPSYERVSLVVTGELRGSLWCASAGWRPEFSRRGVRLDFLSWFEETLLDLRRTSL
jgi:hypothetical protein